MQCRPDVNQLLRATEHMPSVACFDAPNGAAMLTWSTTPSPVLGSWVQATREALRPTVNGPFSGGIVGWLGYESGAQVERMPIPRGPRAAADTCLWRVDGAMHLDPASQTWTVRGTDQFHAEAQALIARACARAARASTDSLPRSWAPAGQQPIAQRYTAGVDQILAAIRSGEVYQVNLAWEHTDIPLEDAMGAWLAIRRANPAQYGAYLRFDGVEIISNSPELFLEVNKESGTLRSCPIKGTATLEAGAKEALEASPKERAELTMIVDLVRNDLGRVAEPGTVRALPRAIRRCGDLWHAEQTVEARIRPTADAVDAVAAAFPPGSVTGAPKVKAMEVIHRLEPVPRGVYTGAIGWFGDSGDARFSVAIRTATVTGGHARFHVGAGIVADSQPEREWEETLAKAQALAVSLGA